MIYCAVKGCYCYDKEGSEQRFFRFPKYLERALLWHEFCNDLSKAPSIKRYVCDKHFLESDFTNPDLLQLKNSAIPSVNGPDRTNLKKPDDETIERDSSLISQFKNNDPNNATSSKKSKPDKCDRKSPDISNPVLKQSFHKRSGTVFESYQGIDPELKLSLIESISASINVKRKSSTNSGYRPLKVYKSIHQDLEVELQPQIVFPDEKIDQQSTEPEKTNNVFKSSRNCAFKNLDITLNSTLVFESDNNKFNPNLMVKSNTFKSNLSKLNKVKGIKSSAKKLFTNENISLKQLPINAQKNKTKLKSLKTELVSPQTETHSCPSQKQLDEINVVQNKKQVMYRNKVLNDKSFHNPHLDVNDPKYSIAAIAESLGTFNSFVEEPVEEVDLEAGDWHKLYEPSEINFPKLTETQIGSMVSHLRSKLTTLNDRDKLEVSFLLSLMSVYPSAPEHIKELLSQRLNLVYIATMFKWNTALALGLNVYKQTTASNTSPSNKSRYRNKTFQNPNVLASTNSNFDSVENDPTNSNARKDNFLKTVKRPQFAYEIIVQEKFTKAKKNESVNTTKER